MKKDIFTCILLLLSSLSFAQQFKVEIGSGFGSYGMNDLKDFNETYLKVFPINAKLTDDFPAQPYYSLGFIYQATSVFSIGLTGNFNTTGSRISYKDYSGELIYDNVLTAYSPGIRVGLLLSGSDNKLRLSEETNFSYSFATLKMKEKVISNNEEMTFRSNSIQIEPGFKLSYPVHSFEIGAKAGYLFDLKGKNKLDGDAGSILQTENKKEIKTNWSGFRLGLSLSYLF